MKITIITATRNNQATIRDTIESVLGQGYKDIEYIIIDGVSGDRTLEIAREYEPRFEGRMRIVSEPDSGIYDAMNKGIALATGEVVGFLNSDDFFSSDDILEKIAEGFSDGSIDAVYGDVHYVDRRDLKKCVRYYSSAKFTPSMMRRGWMPAHPSFYCKREVYEKYGSFDCSFKVAADFEALLRLIYVNGIRVKYLPLDCVTMRTGGASTSGLKSHKQIFSDHMRAYRKNGVRSNYFLEASRYIEKLFDICMQKINFK